ncbi:MAG: autotransporter-associated beta strand repeat-containing protein [Pirellulales bacterium]|nr:autotransporter-associated beta strand repeat-containing protein [Pirellulales bacterium]
MNKYRVSKVLIRAALGVLALAALAACVAPASADTVLFQDNFSYVNGGFTTPGTAPDYTDGYSPDINTGLSFTGRQSGSLVDAGGPISYTQLNFTEDSVLWNGYLGAQNGYYEVIQSGAGTSFTPNVNFNGSLSAGGLIISYDAANWSPWTGDYLNIAISSIGCPNPATNPNPSNICEWTTPHFSFEWGYGSNFANSVYGMWNSGSAIVGGGLPVSVWDSALHHVDMVCTDTSGHDNNPFDGVGNTHIELYVDSVLVDSYTKGGGGYADNYITLGGFHYNVWAAQEWDNFTVTQTEVPVTPLNQWAGAATGDWSDGTKWSLGSPPGGQGAVAQFMALSTTDVTVNVTAPVTVGTLVFDNTHSYTIQSASSSDTITLDNSGGTGNAAVQVYGGSHTISASLAQAGNLDLNLAIDTALDISGTVTGAGYDWTIHGPGTLTLTGAASGLGTVSTPYTGTTSDDLTVTGSGASLSAAYINVGERSLLTVSNGATVTASSVVNVNHLLTVTDAGSSLSTAALNVYRLFHYDDPPVAEVAGGGTLSATFIGIDTTGVGGSTVVLSAGGTIDSSYVSGDGVFNFNGGTLINSTGGGAKTGFDVLALVFTNGGSYSLDPGEYLTTSELLGRYDAEAEEPNNGTFTFNGGTLYCRHDPRGLPNYIGAPDQLLTHVYVDADANINLNSEVLEIYQPLEGDGDLKFTSGTVNLYGDNSSWTGNLVIDPYDPYVHVGVIGNNPNGLGVNSVNIPYGSNLLFYYATESMLVTNSITLNGPGNSVDPNAVALAWDPLVETTGYTMTLTGTLTVHNEEYSGAAPDVAAYYGCTLDLNGPITDSPGAVGGLTFGNGVDGSYWGGACRLSGSASNTYQGDTSILSGIVFANKDSGQTAIPSDHISIGSGGGHQGHIALVIEGVDSVSTQLNPAVVLTFNQENSSEEMVTGWIEVSMNGHSQTVGGLDSPETQRASPWNAIANTSTLAAAVGFADYPRPTTGGTLTINTVNVEDDYTYSGKIFDGYESDPSLAVVKDGPGTQRFVPGFAGPDGEYTYTGGTTVKAGTLDVSAVGQFTPNSPITLEGGTLIAGNELSGTVSRLDATHSGTLVAGGETFDTLVLRGAADIGAAVIETDHTLYVTAETNVIDQVTGDDGTLQVTTDASLTSASITVGTLIIGGAAPAPASSPSPVPEPSTLVLLALAGAAFGWFRLRKR